jgi:hypothetical protein
MDGSTSIVDDQQMLGINLQFPKGQHIAPAAPQPAPGGNSRADEIQQLIAKARMLRSLSAARRAIYADSLEFHRKSF